MAKAGNEAPGTSGQPVLRRHGSGRGPAAEYAVVGKVTEGLETVLAIDKLGAGDGPPSQPVVIEKVTVESS